MTKFIFLTSVYTSGALRFILFCSFPFNRYKYYRETNCSRTTIQRNAYKKLRVTLMIHHRKRKEVKQFN